MTARRVTGWLMGMTMVAVLLANPLSAQDHTAPMDVSGSWEFTFMDMAWSFELTTDGHEVSGELVIVDFGDFTLDSVEVHGDELRMSASAGGNDLEFVGTVKDGNYVAEMSGFHDQAPVPFVAMHKRQ
jgi:hypothetical protein